MISGIVTAILLATFFGVTAWAYSARRHRDFEDAAALALRDDGAVPSRRPVDEHMELLP